MRNRHWTKFKNVDRTNLADSGPFWIVKFKEDQPEFPKYWYHTNNEDGPGTDYFIEDQDDDYSLSAPEIIRADEVEYLALASQPYFSRKKKTRLTARPTTSV